MGDNYRRRKYISCVYIIINIINNKVYVGFSKDFFARKRSHISDLNKNKHGNDHLQNAWNKFGKENFIFEILEECKQEHLPSMEHYWCNLLNTHNRDYGYNIAQTNSKKGSKVSEETRLKISKIKKGIPSPFKGKKTNLKHTDEFKKYISDINKKPKSEEHKKKIGLKHKGKIVSDKARENMRLAKKDMICKKPLIINQYDLEGNFIKEWESRKEVANFYKISVSYVGEICRNNIIFKKNFIFKYGESFKNRLKKYK